MKNTKQRLQGIRDNGYDLNFNDVFNESFENYKKIAMSGGLTFIILGVCFLAFCTFYYVFVSNFVSFSNGIGGLDISGFHGFEFLINLILLVFVTSLLAPIYAGVIKMAYNADQNKEVSVSTSFEFYRSQYVKELILANAIIISISLVINYLFQVLNINFVGGILCYTIVFFTFLTPLFIIFGDLKVFEAIQASFITITKQFPVLLGLIIIGILMVCLGFFAFCIGIFFTMPFMYSLYFTIYKKAFGIDEHSEIDEIGLFDD